MPDTPMLTDDASLLALAEELQREPVIAVDLEADSMHCYREKVCLLQFSTPKRTVLLDPLAVSDLAPLKAVLADPSVRKIFHAADYDIRCLNRDFGLEIRGLFDTMISCQFLGEPKVGLADILNKYYGVTMDKQYQRADWSKRPLTPGMIRYAAEDTRHLHRLAQMLEERLVEMERREWVAEEFELLEQVRFAGNGGPLFLRFKGAGTLDRRQLAILEGLLQWRDAEAQRRDCPLFKVFGNKPLLEIARSAPRSERGLAAVAGLPPRLADRYGRKLLQAVEAALALPKEELPSFPRNERTRRDPEAERRLTLLKDWRRQAAEDLQMDPGIVINNALLEEISRRNPAGAAQLAETPGLKRWQQQVLGAGILQALQG